MIFFYPKFRLQRGHQRLRGVSATSDYLESARKGKREGEGGDSEEGGERREGRRGRKSALWIAGAAAGHSSNGASGFLQRRHMAD